MKTLFIVVVQLFYILCLYLPICLFHIIWHGALPKVSPWHILQADLHFQKRVSEDKYLQSRECPDPKYITIEQYKEALLEIKEINKMYKFSNGVEKSLGIILQDVHDKLKEK